MRIARCGSEDRKLRDALAYERLRAFPIDVWNERVLRKQYFQRRKKMTAQRLREFSETYFGEHGGYAQQYLFHHARTEGKGSMSKSKKKNCSAGQVVRAQGLG